VERRELAGDRKAVRFGEITLGQLPSWHPDLSG
jgi:hypothetical protein